MISVIIPAHNESTVLARTLKAILGAAEPDEFDIVVVCNGCTDTTASVARSFGPQVRVIETDIASKANALNLGDQASNGFPRVYVDADVILTTDAIRELAHALKDSGTLVVAPTATYDLSGCSWPVRTFFEVRAHLPSAKEGIGGSGVYALSEKGRSRFGQFPLVTADDGYVRLLFQAGERKTLESVYSTVFAPRTVRDLLAQKVRTHYGSYELRSRFPELRRNLGETNHKRLSRLLVQPRLWLSLLIYSAISGLAKWQARNRLMNNQCRWDRDESSRSLV